MECFQKSLTQWCRVQIPSMPEIAEAVQQLRWDKDRASWVLAFALDWGVICEKHFSKVGSTMVVGTQELLMEQFAAPFAQRSARFKQEIQGVEDLKALTFSEGTQTLKAMWRGEYMSSRPCKRGEGYIGWGTAAAEVLRLFDCLQFTRGEAIR